jgi:hypothetical protein
MLGDRQIVSDPLMDLLQNRCPGKIVAASQKKCIKTIKMKGNIILNLKLLLQLT